VLNRRSEKKARKRNKCKRRARSLAPAGAREEKELKGEGVRRGV